MTVFKLLVKVMNLMFRGVTNRLNINAGYTRLMSVKNDHGDNVNSFTPRHLAHLTGVYKVPQIENLKVGASLNWQSDTHIDIAVPGLAEPVLYEQGSYATLNLMANYKIDDHWSAAINLYIVNNKKYLASMIYAGSGTSYYATPVNGLAKITSKY